MGKGSRACDLPDPGKGESTEKEVKTDKTVQLIKRRSETEGEEPKAKKGGIAGGKETVKPVELKSASEVSKVSGRAGVPADERSEKRPHTPRSGIVLKKAEEVQEHDAGEKAPHGESSDEADDAELAENWQKASSVARTSRKGQEGSDGPRSVEGLCGDEETRTVGTSSKVTVSGVVMKMRLPVCSCLWKKIKHNSIFQKRVQKSELNDSQHWQAISAPPNVGSDSDRNKRAG